MCVCVCLYLVCACVGVFLCVCTWPASSTGDSDPKPICPLQHESPARVFTEHSGACTAVALCTLRAPGPENIRWRKDWSGALISPEGRSLAPPYELRLDASPRLGVPLNGEQSIGQPDLIII